MSDGKLGVAIVGSCVTRDLITHIPSVLEKICLQTYLARATVISIVAKQSHLIESESLNGIPENFEARCFRQDAAKQHSAILRGKAVDVVLLDLIDERHSTYIFGDCALTRTKISDKCVHRISRSVGYTIVNPLSEDWQKMQRKCLPLFAKLLKNSVGGRRFVVHAAKYAKSYIENDRLVYFDDQKKIESWNIYLDWAYRVLVEELSADVIDVSAAQTYAGGQHLWDLAPFHYDKSYYSLLWKKLEQHLGIKDKTL
jgi:Family of unknown function (DUF6270)